MKNKQHKYCLKGVVARITSCFGGTYWRKKKVNYHILIPPLSKPFEEFTPREAEEFFKWYKSRLGTRIEYLRNYSGVDLNYSVDSLIDIWTWFLEIAEIEKTPVIKMKELRRELRGQPKEIAEAVLNEQSRQFSLETEHIIRDIAMYFGEVCVRNNPSISWGYHTDKKKDSFANMPLLVGFEDRDFTPPFKAHFDPTFMIRGTAYALFDGDQKPDDLVELYDKWQRLVHN